MRRGNPPWLPWADTEVRPYDQICLEEIPIFNTLVIFIFMRILWYNINDDHSTHHATRSFKTPGGLSAATPIFMLNLFTTQGLEPAG